MQIKEKLKNKEDISIQIFSNIALIDAVQWNTIFEALAFYQRHEFLSAIESIQQNLEFRYVLVFKDEKLIAAVYMQLLDFSFRNLVHYGTEKSSNVSKKIKQYIAAKSTKLLHLGNVFFTGDKGIITNDDTFVLEILPEILKKVRTSFEFKKPTAYLISNITLKEENKCNYIGNNAFHAFTTEPDMYLKLHENWHSFDDYLNTLSSKYRVRAKKIFQTSYDIISKELSLTDIEIEKQNLEKLYNNVVNHVAFNMAVLNIDFFNKMKAIYKEQCKIIAYYLGEKQVGFACVFLVDTAVVHVHYIGLDYDINKQYKLYNRMLLDFVRLGIENNKKAIHFGRTATEIKTTIGAEPTVLKAYLKMKNPLFNAALPYFLKRIRPTEYIVRNPFK